MDKRVFALMDKALAGEAPNYDDCVYLLGFDDISPEATYMRGIANDIVRVKGGNSGTIVGQIGLELYPCEMDCKFCAFGVNHTAFKKRITLDEETIREKVRGFTKDGDLYLLWLMTMNSFDLDYYLNAVRIAREVAPPKTMLYTNIGDTSQEVFEQIKAAGASGIYHIERLDEGHYTAISPERRRETIANARRVGLDVQGCVEPIGPEHTPQQLVERIFNGVADASSTAAVMKRVIVPGTIFKTEATSLRIAQIMAVNALAMLVVDPYPILLGGSAESISLVSGSNFACAETGVNPRDTKADTSTGRGLDVSTCRNMLINAGFRRLRRGDGTLVELTWDYISACDANE
jgi:biotin synthase